MLEINDYIDDIVKLTKPSGLLLSEKDNTIDIDFYDGKNIQLKDSCYLLKT